MANITASMVKELRDVTGGGMMDCKKALSETGGDLEAAKELLRKKGQALADKKSSRDTKEGAIRITGKSDKVALVKIACETDFVTRNDEFQKFLDDIASDALRISVTGFDKQDGPIKEKLVGIVAKLGENIQYMDGIQWDAQEGCFLGSYIHSNGKIGVVCEIEAKGTKADNVVTELAKDICMHIAASHVEAISDAELDPAVLDKEKAFLIDQAKDSGKPDNIIEKMVEGRMKKFKKEICLLSQNFVKNPELTIQGLLKDKQKEVGCDLKVTRFFKSNF